MMDAELQNVYGLFWSAYGVGLVLFLWATQKLLRFLPFYGLRTLLLAALTAVLVAPVESLDIAGWWIPAWLYGGYELILGNSVAASAALLNLALAGMVLLLVWILDLVRYRIKH
jgi:hypothetical protein